MIVTISELGRRVVVGWVDIVRRFAMAATLLAVCATVWAGYFVVENVSINTDTEDMLAADLPFRVNSRALSDAFPQFSDNILVVIDGHTPDVADDAAMALGEAMRAMPKQFGDVYDLAGHAFFRKNGLLYLDVDELYELSDRLAEAQPFLGALWRDPSLRGLLEMLDLAIDELLKGDGGEAPIEIDRVLNAMSASLEAQKEGRFDRLSWQRLMMEAEDSEGPYRRFILIQPALDFGSLQPAEDAIDALRALARDLHLTTDNGIRVRLTGSAAMAQEELKSVEQGMGLATFLSFVLVVGLLLFGLRSVKLAAATLITLIMGLVWTAGFAVAAVGQLNLISVAFAVLFIGLSVDFGIHFGLRYKESIDRGADNAKALGEAARSVGGALTLCAVAASIGFFSFLPTAYRGLAELGLIAGAGMFIALFSNLTVLPALISLSPLRRGATRVGRVRFSLSAAVTRNARTVLWGALALGVASALLLPKARFDFDPLNLKDRNTESVATYFDLIEGQHTGPYSVTVLEKNHLSAKELSEKVNVLEEVYETATLADYVPSEQEEKLDVIGTMALFVAPGLASEIRASAPKTDDNRKALIASLDRLNRLAEKSAEGSAGRAAERLAAAIDALGGARADDAVILEMQERLVASLPARLAQLRASLEAGPVDLDSLPAALRIREIAQDGRARLEIYPREDLTDRDALKRFVTAVRAVAPNATGGPIIILEAGNAVVKAFRDAALIALGGIIILLA
ncbi:MAG: MMPL family transporter, partial [Rhodospirillales bacterium]|nr:MMPL family transporter [Rhodospirillales bacterium]